MEEKTTFGDVLRNYIRRSGYTQAELARKLYYAPATINKWIHEYNQIPLSVLQQICEVLILSPTETVELMSLAGYAVRNPNVSEKQTAPFVLKNTSSTFLLEREQIILAEQLNACKPGKQYWQEFEQICIDILTMAFVPPLRKPKVQARTWSGLERRDALFPLLGAKGGWEEIRQDYAANFLLCEFKNYSEPIEKDEVNQTRNYLRKSIGRIGIIFSRLHPSVSALDMRRVAYTEEGKIILFCEDRHLIEFLELRAARESPLELIQGLLIDFLASYE